MADDKSSAAANLEAEMEALSAEAPDAAMTAAEKKAEDKAAADEENHDRNLKLIMDIPLKVTVELGRAKMVVSELLNLGQGSVIELSKLAGEPMEVLVNDKLVARGEAVVVNEKFGVRLTDIISQTERVEQLK